MQSSLSFKVKAGLGVDRYRVLELFFKDWVDNTCNNEVHYKMENQTMKSTAYEPNAIYRYHIFEVMFDKQEDALALMLRGVPEEFQNYLEIVQ